MVRVLGGFTATVGDDAVNLGGPRQRAVLARILVGGPRRSRPSSCCTTCGASGPSRRPSAPCTPFVSRLRRVLGPDAMPQRPGGYVLDRRSVARRRRPVRTEVDDGRRALARGNDDDAAALLEAALARWTGPSAFGPGAQARHVVPRRRVPTGSTSCGWRRPRRSPTRTCAWAGRATTSTCWRASRRATRCGSRWPPSRYGALRRGPPGRRARRLRALPRRAGRRSSGSTRRRRCAACTPPCWPRSRWARCVGGPVLPIAPAARAPLVRRAAGAARARRRRAGRRRPPPGRRPHRAARGGQDRAGAASWRTGGSRQAGSPGGSPPKTPRAPPRGSPLWPRRWASRRSSARGGHPRRAVGRAGPHTGLGARLRQRRRARPARALPAHRGARRRHHHLPRPGLAAARPPRSRCRRSPAPSRSPTSSTAAATGPSRRPTLAELLGDLPLALQQACAYVEQTG